MIDRATIDDAIGNEILDRLERAGWRWSVWDATSDIGVATFHCLITDSADPQGHMGLGSGTHPDRAVALTRALTEAVQTRMNYITGARDDLKFEEFTAEGRAQQSTGSKGAAENGGAALRFHRRSPRRLQRHSARISTG